jgi:iron complex outermembrane receptor protein
MRTKLFAGAAFAALVMPAAAFAQSTGSQDFDAGGEIVVTGNRETDVGGVEIPDTPKARVVLSQEIISRQTPGQTVNQIINLVPGVSFTNNDPFGSAGGSFTIRGFDSSRVSQTVDGLPLNDSGNYSLYANQQIDPELIETVNVNLGSTDVDSPTAAAVGGTVNINTLNPSEEMGAMLVASYGDIAAEGAGYRPFHRVFGMIQTGDVTGAGTRAWVSASVARNESSFADYGKIEKQQYNAKIRQDIGTNGDFISIAGHYNENRNNFGGSPLSASAFGDDKSVRFYNVVGGIPCETTTPRAGFADRTNTCGTSFERRYNPSNTGNVRLNSLFHLAEQLTLSVDGAYQYTKANGGGTNAAREQFFTPAGTTANLTGTFGGNYYFGRDLNGDGDTLDQVLVANPSQTRTHRYNAIVNLAYDVNESNRVRAFYALDTASHRQTGEAAGIYSNGEPFDVFPANDPLTDAAGNILQKRDRESEATLHLVGAEYRGRFLQDRLTVLIGGNWKFFKRGLQQNCFTTASNGNVDCIAGGDIAAYAAASPYIITAAGRPTGAAAPFSRDINYDKFLPNVGFTYHFTEEFSLGLNYAKNISVPGTDTLYNSLYAPAGSEAATPTPETADSFDLSLRYTSGKVQASITPWYSKYKNRIVSAYNLDCDCSIDTNLGEVEKYGVDASIAYRPVRELLLYAFGSYIGSEIKDNVLAAPCSTADAASGACFTQGGQSYFATAGNRERSAPEWLAGARVQATLGNFDLGAQAKYTGGRFLNDTNTFEADGYTVVDLDARYSLAGLGLDKAALQLNVTNIFDEFYIGSFSGGLNTLGTGAFVNFGAPRTVIGSLIVGF